VIVVSVISRPGAGGGQATEPQVGEDGGASSEAPAGEGEGTAEEEAAAVSHSCACIGSPCLRHCVHGASIGGGPGG
jgi:hypothetical protein